MRKLPLMIILVFVVAVGLIAVVSRVRSAPASTIVGLTSEQAKAIKQVDDSLETLKKQFDDLQTQRAALVTGFALSNPKLAAEGLEWSKKYNFEKDAAGNWGFRLLTPEEQNARSQQPGR